MILILRAALFGAAQEAIVVYEGATTNHNVASHTGSNYIWGVYINFSPDINAPPDDYKLLTSNGLNIIQVQWNNSGLYYLKVTETDLKGCENLKVLPVRVISNDRSIGFLTSVSSSCFNADGNEFSLPLMISGNNGQQLTAELFPMVVEFSVNGKGYSQQIPFGNQAIQISNDWLNANSQNDFSAKVEITAARDVHNNDIPPDVNMKTHVRTIFALPEIEFETVVTMVEQGSSLTHKVNMVAGKPENSVYHWSIDPGSGTTTDLSLLRGPSATILWDGPPGYYSVRVSVTDGNGCTGETISKQIQIIQPSGFILSAGRDTTIGGCKPYQLQATVEQQPGVSYSYLWKPAINLNNASVPNPVFTPGSSTTFVVIVTSSKGATSTDTVKITVSEILASAGNDVFILPNTTAILDGTASVGSKLVYQWTTNSGKIESGANTPNPVVSSFGAYYLKVTDEWGCSDTDTMNVYRLTQAPVASDDYDTTSYRTETIIPVLNNDTDPQNSINRASLKITSAPLNGSAYVDYGNYNIRYRPSEGFSGNEIFEYEICNTDNLCDKAKVFVLVTEFEFRIPNAFSPNGDGINDFFRIIGIEKYQGNSITIVNRWGNKVYEAKNYGIDTYPVFWDGFANTGTTFLGDELPTGTYYYMLDLGNGEKPISGSIYLDR
jgi:gliding motility-associated-like protein